MEVTMLTLDATGPLKAGSEHDPRLTISDEIERAENEGMPDPQQAEQSTAPAPDTLAETTMLERRVLAHERILQSLIAHLSELDPRYLERLKTTFVAPLTMKHYEQDYTETEDYAAEFIRAIEIIGQAVPTFAIPAVTHLQEVDRAPASKGPVVGFFTPTLFMIRQRENQWDLLVDGHPYSSFDLESEALDAATRLARRIASRGPVEVRSSRKPESSP
ncbi:MAG: hypothetical protein WAK98_08995 [Gemmobacter sp.]|jgi:hypothetical protein